MSAGSWMSCTRMSPLSQCLPTTLAGTRSAPAARDTRAAVYRAPYSAGRRLSLIPPSTDTYSRVSRSSTVTGFTVPTVYRVSVVGPTIARPGSTEIRGTVVPSSAQVASTTPATLTGHLMPEVDLGGGFGIAYTPGEVPLDPVRVAKGVAGVVDATCAELGTTVPRISVEPGRAIVGPTTLTLYTVGTVKPVTVDERLTRLYVSVDGGMSDNLRPALYGARYTAALVSRAAGADLVPARVVGKHCESGDILVHDVQLPADIAPGDLLAVPATGAYGRSMASNYNHVPRPPVVAVRDGVARVIVRRETEQDLMALDVG